jgi:hypothetical protein
MRNGIFQVGDRVDHKTLGYRGAVVAIYSDGIMTVSSNDKFAAEDLTMVNAAAIQDAFEIGFKAAGGSIAPDVMGGGPWKIVEITLDRDEIDILADLADDVVDDPVHRAYDQAPALRRFLDKISIFRRKK